MQGANLKQQYQQQLLLLFLAARKMFWPFVYFVLLGICGHVVTYLFIYFHLYLYIYVCIYL